MDLGKRDTHRLKKILREFFYQSELRNKFVVNNRILYSQSKRSYRYLCAGCRLYYNVRVMEVDHVHELKNSIDLTDWIKSLFNVENLQMLCKSCHRKKTIGLEMVELDREEIE